MATRDERLARVRQATDREHGEPVRITPMRTGNYGVGPDTDRTVFDVVAKVDVGEGKEVGLDGGTAQTFKARLPLNEAECLVDPAIYPAALTAKTGDRVTLLSPARLTRTTYEIARIDRGQLSRLVFRMNAL